MSLVALCALAFALVHGACPESGKAGSECPLCVAVRTGMHLDAPPTPVDVNPSFNPSIDPCSAPTPSLFSSVVRHSRAPPVQNV